MTPAIGSNNTRYKDMCAMMFLRAEGNKLHKYFVSELHNFRVKYFFPMHGIKKVFLYTVYVCMVFVNV